MCVSYQVKADISVDTKHQTVTGISFPVDADAWDKLSDLKDGRLNYVQLVSCHHCAYQNVFFFYKKYLSKQPD